MLFDVSKLCRKNLQSGAASGTRALAAGLLAGCLGLSAASAVKAEEDTNMLNSLAGFVGLQVDPEKDSIDYRARPPLVVPPKRDLPTPLPAGAGRRADWPNDPDVLARRRAAADSRRPMPQIGPNTRAELSKEELMQGRTDKKETDTQSDCQPGAGTHTCLYAPWSNLKATSPSSQTSSDSVQEGEEPSRNFLTEPPSGYRRPTATVKASGYVPKQEADPGDAGAYVRSQRHKTSVE